LKAKWQLIATFINNNISLVTGTFVSGFCYNVFTLLIPISIGRFYEFNFGFSSHRLQLIESLPLINSSDFNTFLYFFIGLVAVRFLFEYLNKFLIALIGEKFAKDLREKLFTHQLQIGTEIYDQKGIGKYLLRYSGDLKSIQNYVSGGLFRFAQDVFLILILLMTIGYFDKNLGFILGGSILFSTIILAIINTYLYKVSVQRRNKRSGMLSFVNTRLRAIGTIKAFNKYTPEEKRYQKRSDELYDIGKNYQKVASLIQSIIPMLTYIMLGILMLYVYHVKKEVDQSALLILILLIISFLPILRRVLRISIIWKLGNISFEKLINIFNLRAENTLKHQELNLAKAELSFEGVSFGYPNATQEVFKNASITISPQNITFILGNSGSGKSTFISLLIKSYRISNGQINLGSNLIANISEKSIRKHIAVVSKDFPLFGRDVYESIVYSRNTSRKEKATRLLKDIQQFEHSKDVLSLETKIGDLGSILTSSQEKLLMYCRAFLTNKPVLIIDEPFKDLNPATTNYVKSILNKIKSKKSIIILGNSLPEELKIDSCYEIKEQCFIKQF
jgi:ABC-type multidrug transport system fused ATPase/permease subunit